jgi:ABC-type multidrug transport system ATPase subunit
MGFIRQTWTLVEKTLLVVLWRNWLGTSILCFFAPIIFIFIIAYSKNFFVPPANFGIGSPLPIRSLYDAVSASAGGRNTVAFINNGFTGGQIEAVINQISEPIRSAGKQVRVLTRPNDVLTVCPSTIRGVTPCFAGVVFHSSPTEGNGGIWNYTIRADGSFGTNIYVERGNNDAQIYTIPLQRAIDNAIASVNGTSLPAIIDEYPYTSQNAAERDRSITRRYMGTLISILGLVYFVGIVGVCYQLPGHMAEERELGMSSLIESMMSTPRRWIPQAARLLSLHIAFDLMYLPSWVIMSLIVARLNYPISSAGIMVGFYIISGLSLSSWASAFASFFRKAQLSGITVTITSIVLAILIQVIPPPSTGAVIVLSLIFPPINFTIFIIYMAYWQQQSLPARLGEAAPDAPWRVPGFLFFVFAFIHLIAYPLVAFLIERIRYGTASKSRQLVYAGGATPEAVKITSLNKVYPPSRFWAAIGRRFPRFSRPAVHAVNDLSLSVLRGQITVLLGANGSGKSTTLDMLAGLQKPTSGNIEIDATGGIGLCPQKNVLWDDLTVYEHVRIFNRLKSEKIDSRAELEALIAACDLEQKKKARSETLSGGQKRKCQLAMMLTGGSSLCMLDEVSSGLDPLSRRKIWDIILAERGKRSILMTTHFLDEADLLSDDIAVLSKGKLVANSSAVELKHHLGGGYRVKIYHENARDLPAELSTVPSQKLSDHTVFRLASSASAADFIARLEHAGVREYQVNGPSIEDVFLKLAEEVRDDLEKDRVAVSSASGSEEYIREEKPLKLVPGKTLSFFGQTWVLFRKRAIILRRNSWPYLAALLIPIITAGLTTLFIKGFKGLSCDPADQVALTPVSASLENYLAMGARIITGPNVDQRFINQLYPLLNSSSYRNVSSFGQFQDLLNRNYSRVRPGGIYLGDTPTFAWRGDYSLYWAIAVQNLLDISLLKIPIIASFDSFDLPFSPEAGNSLQLILYFGLAMSAFPGFFALYVNVERTRNVRALHYSNGVRAGPLWLAYTLFDFLIVLLVSR